MVHIRRAECFRCFGKRTKLFGASPVKCKAHNGRLINVQFVNATASGVLVRRCLLSSFQVPRRVLATLNRPKSGEDRHCPKTWKHPMETSNGLELGAWSWKAQNLEARGKSASSVHAGRPATHQLAVGVTVPESDPLSSAILSPLSRFLHCIPSDPNLNSCARPTCNAVCQSQTQWRCEALARPSGHWVQKASERDAVRTN